MKRDVYAEYRINGHVFQIFEVEVARKAYGFPNEYVLEIDGVEHEEKFETCQGAEIFILNFLEAES